jgi:hypothetical protein
MKKEDLYKLEIEVKNILETVPPTRNNDNFLFITYWHKKFKDINFMEFFSNPRKHGGRAYKSVERVRRGL